jgi:diguanylate cyclase (GGDEF)-like protein
VLRHLAAILAVALLALAAYSLGALRPLDDRLAEFRFGQVTRAPTGDIVLVDIDAKSLAAIGTWPWPRNVHADIIDALTRLEAAEIAFDIDFSTRSTPAADLALEAALRRANGSVILAVFNQDLDGDGSSGVVHPNQPLARFAQHAWTATVNVRADRDGTVRGFPFGGIVDGVPTASMPAMLGGHVGALDGAFLIDFGIDAAAIDRISAIDLIRGDVDPARIQGRKVLVGAAAVELHDLFQVPRHGIVSGPLLQALGAESILQARTLQKSPPALSLAGLALFALGVLALRRVKWTISLALLALASVSFEAAALLVQSAWPVLLDTSLWHAAALGFAISALFREIGFRRILLAISSTETRNTRKILAQVVADNLAGVVVANEDGRIHAASRSAAELLQPDSCDLAGRSCAEALPPVLAGALAEAIRAFRLGRWDDKGPQELVYDSAAGEPRILEYAVRPSRLSGGISRGGKTLADSFIASLTFVDVTERRKAEARLAYLARFDTLTGLSNRNQFCEVLAGLLERRQAGAQGGAVLFFDLDRFKNVNDTLGHKYGDLLLRAVAQRVQALIGPGDLASRFGGDEYAVIRRGDGRDSAVNFAGELIRKIGEPYQIEGHRLIIGVSIGIAYIQGADTDPMQVMKNADTALYRAKASGGNAYRIYATEMDARLKARQALEVDLWDAFERNQFEVHYQPQVDLASEAVIGVEALVRWRHPTRGFVSPAEFVPVAEAVGLIEPLGAFVLKEACAVVARWPKPIKVAVNVSPLQFTRGDLVATVRSALAASGLSPKQLDLEITESLFIHENRVIRDTMDALRAMGISFSIDDFGTGYSSLSYIRKFPVQKLKIDQSFVAGLPFDKESLAIVGAVAALAQSLGIRVNAEGVETPEQAALLRLLGCGEGQGYLYGRPVSAAEIVRMLEEVTPAERLTA